MKIQAYRDIQASDLKAMSVKQLRALASQGNKITNERIASLKAHKATSSFAYQELPKKVQKAGGYKLQSKMSKSQLVNMIQSQQAFLGKKSSTVTGWNKMISRSNKVATENLGKTYKKFVYTMEGKLTPYALAKKYGIRYLTSKQFSRAMTAYKKLKEARPEETESIGSPEMVQNINELALDNPTMTVEELLKELEERVQAAYEERETEQARLEAEILAGSKKQISKKSKGSRKR